MADGPRIQQLEAELLTLRQNLALLSDLALAGETPIDDLLQKIADAARILLHAQYAALGIVDQQGQVKHFFTAGLSPDERARIGPLPRGEGLLGLIGRERRIIRSRRVDGHPDSVGFPPNHPPMESFLGGPIARGEVLYGNLSLTNRLGAAEFTDADEELLAILSRQAAIAIDNAERFARARRSERTMRTLFEIGRSLASATDPHRVVSVVTVETLRLLAADVVGIGVPARSGSGFSWSVARTGSEATQGPFLVVPESRIIREIVATGTPFSSNSPIALLGDVASNPILVDVPLGSTIIVPLGHGSGKRGVLLAGWREAGVLSDDIRDILERLADRAAIALEQVELLAREQAALHQSQLERASLEATFDSLTDGIFTTDLVGQIVRVNRQAASLARHDLHGLVGQPAEQAFRLVDDRGQALDWPDNLQASTHEANLRSSDGTLIPIEQVISIIADSTGQPQGTVQVLRDLRPQREVEQLKSNIISLVSHELRTPLSHIKGYASSLLQPDVTWDAETQHDFISSIDRQADRLARLINDLLEISRLDAGGTARLEPIAIAPSALVERGVRLAMPNLGDHPLTVRCLDSLPLVLADPQHLERVLANLVENAAKYSPDGSLIEIEVAAAPDEVGFAVRDRGLGLNAEEQSHLFERFYRSPRVKHRTPGTGLGLAICREIIRAHNGRIEIASTEGEGSVFRFTLPWAP